MNRDSILSSPFVENLSEYAPGVEPTLKDQTIYPFVHTSEKSIISVIGAETFMKIRDASEDSPLKEHTIAALCNLVMYNYKIWEVVLKRQNQQQDTYKYEMEMMQSSYIDNYFSHIDDVIKQLNEQSTEFPEWKTTPSHKLIAGLLLKDASEFDLYYGIDNSYYFFFVTIYLQRKVLDKYILPMTDPASLDESLLRRVKTVTAQLTVAYALRQLDFISLPKTIRNARADGPSRTSVAEQSAMIALSDYLIIESERELASIAIEINKPESGGDIPSDTNLNAPDNKYFFMV